MQRLDPNARAVLLAIWKAGGRDHREVEGVAFLASLQRDIDEQILLDLLRELRQDGLVDFYVPGSQEVADLSMIRLTPAGREIVVQLPESGERLLESDQERLLEQLVEAARAAPRHEQQWHLGGEYLGPNVLQGPWGEKQVLVNDIRVLEEMGFLKAVHRNYVYGNDYVITPTGYEFYAGLKERASEPIERQEQSVRSFMEAEFLRKRCPLAYQRWSEAEALLWAANSDNEFTTIGHKIREASHEFANALVSEHQPPDVDSDVTKVKNRLRSVIDLYRKDIGRTRMEFLDALLEYWNRSVDLIQRQEHARSLSWQDARRVVLQTAILMFEFASILDELGRRDSSA